MPTLYFIQKDFEFSFLHLPRKEDENYWFGCIWEDRLPAKCESPVEITVWAVDLERSTVYRQEKGFDLHPGAAAESNYERPREAVQRGWALGEK